MPEPTDVIMPILQRIQADVAGVKKDIADVKGDVQRVDGKVDGVSSQVAALSSRMDTFETYFTYTLGLTQRHAIDIKQIRSEIAAINSRLPENPR